jgi:hypothetical protein
MSTGVTYHLPVEQPAAMSRYRTLTPQLAAVFQRMLDRPTVAYFHDPKRCSLAPLSHPAAGFIELARGMIVLENPKIRHVPSSRKQAGANTFALVARQDVQRVQFGFVECDKADYLVAIFCNPELAWECLPSLDCLCSGEGLMWKDMRISETSSLFMDLCNPIGFLPTC